MNKKYFGTYNGYKNLNGDDQSIWHDLCNEYGAKVKKDLNFNIVRNQFKFIYGNRYLFEVDNSKRICSIKLVYKNKRCDIFRKANNTFHFISGKYNYKKIEEINKIELVKYLNWLLENSTNEATISNSIQILNEINK